MRVTLELLLLQQQFLVSARQDNNDTDKICIHRLEAIYR